MRIQSIFSSFLAPILWPIAAAAIYGPHIAILVPEIITARERPILGDNVMINKNISEGGWKDLKGRVQSAWGELTEDEWTKAKGDVSSLAGLIQKKFGAKQEEVRQKLNDWMAGPQSENKSKSA